MAFEVAVPCELCKHVNGHRPRDSHQPVFVYQKSTTVRGSRVSLRMHSATRWFCRPSKITAPTRESTRGDILPVSGCSVGATVAQEQPHDRCPTGHAGNV